MLSVQAGNDRGQSLADRGSPAPVHAGDESGRHGKPGRAPGIGRRARGRERPKTCFASPWGSSTSKISRTISTRHCAPDAEGGAAAQRRAGLDHGARGRPAEGFDVHAMTFRYGQRHAHEIDAARRVARRSACATTSIVDIDLRSFGGSALTGDDRRAEGPRRRRRSRDGIPITYVPARNTIFLSFALAWAEVLGARDIFIGVNALDYCGYPDCRPEYIAAFERMANLATRGGVEGTAPIRIHTPLIDLTKAEIIRARTLARRRLRAHAELLRSRSDRRRLRPLRRLPTAPEGIRRSRHRRPIPTRYASSHASDSRHDCTPSRRSSTRCRAKAPTPAGRRCFVVSPGAICGRDARRIARRRFAISVIPTSSASDRTEESSRRPTRSPTR